MKKKTKTTPKKSASTSDNRKDNNPATPHGGAQSGTSTTTTTITRIPNPSNSSSSSHPRRSRPSQRGKSSSASSSVRHYYWSCLAGAVVSVVLVIPWNASTANHSFFSLFSYFFSSSSSSSTGGGNNHKRSGRRQESLPLLDRLFPNQSLDQAWESYPLLCTLYDLDDDQDNNVGDNHSPTTTFSRGRTIPKFYIRNPTEQLERLALVKSLFSNEDILPVLYPITTTTTKGGVVSEFTKPEGMGLKHGDDYRVVRRIIGDDGQEWSAMPPGQHIPPKQLVSYIRDHQWSLIVNQMQSRWPAISQWAQEFQTETNCHDVNCNLYFTPQPPLPKKTDEGDENGKEKEGKEVEGRKWNSGFESHWDEMDVIVMQLEGQKEWSIAASPQIFLGTPDQRYKPTLLDLSSTLWYDNVMLRPGDILYIPRGFIHNASTTTTITASSTTSSRSEWESRLHHHPKELVQGAISSDPSLHLTFGIQHRCDTTMEALLHHAIEIHADRGNRIISGGSSMSVDGSWMPTTVAVSAQDCQGREILYKDILHLVISEVARREAVCQNADGYNVNKHPQHGYPLPEGGCFLRQSIPLSKARQQVMMTTSSSSLFTTTTTGNSINDDDLWNRDTALLETLMVKGFQVVQSLVNCTLLTQFVQQWQLGQGEKMHFFYHPYLSGATPSEAAPPCPSALSVLDQDILRSYLMTLSQAFEYPSGRGSKQQQRQQQQQQQYVSLVLDRMTRYNYNGRNRRRKQ